MIRWLKKYSMCRIKMQTERRYVETIYLVSKNNSHLSSLKAILPLQHSSESMKLFFSRLNSDYLLLIERNVWARTGSPQSSFLDVCINPV